MPKGRLSSLFGGEVIANLMCLDIDVLTTIKVILVSILIFSMII